MSVDINNNYTGSFYGVDRMGHTTPDPNASDPLRPFLPVQYPAPWLPGKRVDSGHPVGAQVVISWGQAVGLDKSGALVPAGMLSGTQAASADGGQYCLVKYSAADVGFAYNPSTGAKVAAAGEYVLLAAPSDAEAGVTVDGVEITEDDVEFALACNLSPGGAARSVGYAIRNVFQFLGGVTVVSTTGGIAYTLDGMNPKGFAVHNYMHEAGTAVQTSHVLRVPWIGAATDTLYTKAVQLGITGYVQTDYSRSFVHCLGTMGSSAGQLFRGCSIVPADKWGAKHAGNYAPYDSAVHSADQIIGKLIGFESMISIRDYADRVRTQFERASEFVGPYMDANPSTFQMGGSATRGMDYMIHITTNGAFRKAKDQSKVPPDEFGTYALIHVKF